MARTIGSFPAVHKTCIPELLRDHFRPGFGLLASCRHGGVPHRCYEAAHDCRGSPTPANPCARHCRLHPQLVALTRHPPAVKSSSPQQSRNRYAQFDLVDSRDTWRNRITQRIIVSADFAGSRWQAKRKPCPSSAKRRRGAPQAARVPVAPVDQDIEKHQAASGNTTIGAQVPRPSRVKILTLGDRLKVQQQELERHSFSMTYWTGGS